MKKLTIALALAATAVAAQAHHVWIEQDGQAATLYFGEFGDNLREASPGLLDKFPGPVATRITRTGTSTPAVTRGARGFAIGARAGQGESLVAEEPAYPAFERRQGDQVTRGIYVPAARLVTDFAAQPPRLTLDLVPTGKTDGEGVEFQAFFKGQPLPKAKVELVNASGWGQEHHSDEAGKLTVQLPWRGTYVLELAHRDGAGERGAGERYDSASYVTSLTVMQTRGLPALPLPPAAAPNPAN